MAHQGPGSGRRPTPLKPEVSAGIPTAGTPVPGRLYLNEWTSREGERRSRLQVVADAVQFLDKPKTDKPGEPADTADKPAVGAYRRKAS